MNAVTFKERPVVAPARRLVGCTKGGRQVMPCPGWAPMEARIAAHAKRIEIAVEDRLLLEK
jgi:hypothetical protein